MKDDIVKPNITELFLHITTLRKYQSWRTGEDMRTMDEADIDPGHITASLEYIIKLSEDYLISVIEQSRSVQ